MLVCVHVSCFFFQVCLCMFSVQVLYGERLACFVCGREGVIYPPLVVSGGADESRRIRTHESPAEQKKKKEEKAS